MELHLVLDEQRGPGGHVVQVHRGLLRHALPSEGQQVAHDAARPLGLVVDDPEVLAGKVRVRLALQQQLGQAGDGGERVVQLVRHAGDELADRRHLVVLDELRLHDPLLRHVLDQHDHGSRTRSLGERGGSEPQHPLAALQADHDRRGALAPVGRLDQLGHHLRRPEQGLAEAPPHQLGFRGLGQCRERPIGAEHRVAGSDDRHPLGEGVERRLPLLLAPPHDLVEPAVRQYHRRVGRDGGEEPQVLGRERAALPVGDGQRAHGHTLRAERGHRGRPDREAADEVDGGRGHPLGDLDALALDGEAHQRGVRILRHLADERLQRARGARHPQHPAVLVVGQHHDGAVGLEEAAGVLGNLVHDAVELDRLREDVAQLLQREQLADAPVELAGELLALGLRLAQPPPPADDGHPEAAGDVHHRHHRQPPDAVVGEPGDDAEQGGGDGVERHLPLPAPHREEQDQPGRDAEERGHQSRQATQQPAEEGAHQERPGHEGDDAEKAEHA